MAALALCIFALLPIETIDSDNIFEFKKCLKKNLVYSPSLPMYP